MLELDSFVFVSMHNYLIDTTTSYEPQIFHSNQPHPIFTSNQMQSSWPSGFTTEAKQSFHVSASKYFQKNKSVSFLVAEVGFRESVCIEATLKF